MISRANNSEVDLLRLCLNWLTATLAVIVATYLVPSVRVSGFFAAFVTALVLGVINALLRPALILFTLPINILTLGLFTIVINALLVLLTSAIVPGFYVPSFGLAVLFSFILALVNIGLLFLRGR